MTEYPLALRPKKFRKPRFRAQIESPDTEDRNERRVRRPKFLHLTPGQAQHAQDNVEESHGNSHGSGWKRNRKACKNWMRHENRLKPAMLRRDKERLKQRDAYFTKCDRELDFETMRQLVYTNSKYLNILKLGRSHSHIAYKLAHAEAVELRLAISARSLSRIVPESRVRPALQDYESRQSLRWRFDDGFDLDYTQQQLEPQNLSEVVVSDLNSDHRGNLRRPKNISFFKRLAKMECFRSDAYEHPDEDDFELRQHRLQYEPDWPAYYRDAA